MTLNYDEIFVGANKAQKTINKTEIVLDVLRHAEKPMTCKEIGTVLMGEEYFKTKERRVSLSGYEYTYYRRSHEARSWSSFLGRVLNILAKKGVIEAKNIDGEPVTIDAEEWVDNPDAPPSEITVHDDEGNEYTIHNPKYNWRIHGGNWQTVKKTIIPKVRVYSWVG